MIERGNDSERKMEIKWKKNMRVKNGSEKRDRQRRRQRNKREED